MQLSLTFGNSNLVSWTEAIDKLGSEAQAHKAFRRGINRTGAKAFTATKRALSQQTSLTQKKLVKFGQIEAHRANYGAKGVGSARRPTADGLAYTISAKGKEIPLRAFNPIQTKDGARAVVWGRKQVFQGKFIFAGHRKSGKFVGGGNVFKRTGDGSLPVKAMYGPSVRKELVKGLSARAFEDASLDLSRAIQHEIKVLTDGIVS